MVLGRGAQLVHQRGELRVGRDRLRRDRGLGRGLGRACRAQILGRGKPAGHGHVGHLRRAETGVKRDRPRRRQRRQKRHGKLRPPCAALARGALAVQGEDAARDLHPQAPGLFRGDDPPGQVAFDLGQLVAVDRHVMFGGAKRNRRGACRTPERRNDDCRERRGENPEQHRASLSGPI